MALEGHHYLANAGKRLANRVNLIKWLSKHVWVTYGMR